MATRIYTRTGDQGETGLFSGRRVPKDDLRVTAYGTVDELNAALGLAAAGVDDEVRELLTEVQSLLFELGAELATPPDAERRPTGVTQEDIDLLERAIDRYEAMLPRLESFILPAGTESTGHIHLARAVCRRAERAVVRLRREEPETAPVNVVFLNRLSDLLFVVARVVTRRGGGEELVWKPRR